MRKALTALVVLAAGVGVLAGAMLHTQGALAQDDEPVIPTCIPERDPDANDINDFRPPLFQLYEGIANIQGVPAPRGTVLIARIGPPGNDCIGGMTETGSIGTDLQDEDGNPLSTGAFFLDVTGLTDHNGNVLTIYFEDGRTAAAPTYTFTSAPMDRRQIDVILEFPNPPIVRPPDPVDAVTYRGRVFSNQHPNGIPNTQIVATVTSVRGEVYTSAPSPTDEMGNYLLIVDPGTDDFVGQEVTFMILMRPDIVAAQTREFTEFGGINAQDLVFVLTEEREDTELDARLVPDEVEEGGETAILLSRPGGGMNARLSEAVVVDIAFTDEDSVIVAGAPTSVTIPVDQASVTVPLMTTDDDFASTTSTVFFNFSTPTPNFTFGDNNSAVLMVTDPDEAPSGGSCAAGDTASLDNVILLAIPLFGLTIFGGFGVWRGVRRRLGIRDRGKVN